MPAYLERLGPWRIVLAAALLVVAPWPARGGPEGQPDRAIDFEARVLPILKARCMRCHGGAKKSGGLDLSSRAALLKGGSSGPALVLGSADESPIYEKVSQG